MRNRTLPVLFAVVAFFVILPGSQAQFQNGGQSSLLKVPLISQQAVVTQRIGITDVTITYHRPLVRGRKLWGDAVPYGQVWRAGANENTTIEFSDAVTIEGQALPKGIYGLHMIPGENEWTVIFSKTYTAWGSFSYKREEDALRVTVKPHAADFDEALLYEFDDLKPESAAVTMRWEKLAVPFQVGVNVEEITTKSIEAQLRGWPGYTWDAWDDAATYLLEDKGNLDEALKDEDHSIKIEERFDNLLTKSRILDAMNKNEEASTVRDKAIAQATALQLYGYGRLLQQQGRKDQAMAIYRQDLERNPKAWIAHLGSARVYSAQGDFPGATKAVKEATTLAPENARQYLEGLQKKLEARQDINE